MMCLVCRGPGRSGLCRDCAASLSPPPDRWVEGDVLVRSGFRHEGAARVLVHRLKYEGVVAAAERLASPMTELLTGVTCVVPIVRTIGRRHKFGVDPALELARALRRRTGVPVVMCLSAAFTGPVRAGQGRAGRSVPRFTVTRAAPQGAALVDDVVTTGATITAAAALLGVTRSITATSRILGSSQATDRPKHL